MFLTTHKDVELRSNHFELLPFGGGRRNALKCPLAYTRSISLWLKLHSFDIFNPSAEPVHMTKFLLELLHRRFWLNHVVCPNNKKVML
ncbi:hypothetical protein VIGAN_11025700 [Vigna angularis var. angularis]|uniref:Uncharacterized protein n=1 Tax=Vigna angularis var. angularis TaxID=157739 RepID=A0A0S3T7C6_PHAAN|nr:hypothetical protein VIGAN_11025700 [Vigna angularis var. angularis]